MIGTRFMGLETGGHLGLYEIVSPLGRGGMGEVYRARDPRLGREVALKVVPESMAQDAQLMARFEREARTLASLNHPNIAALYGLEESGSVAALVMELVEGETLEERIGRASATRRSASASTSRTETPSGGSGSKSKTGVRPASGSGSRKTAVPLDDALSMAKQMAEALEYAHERGVVHRDLKPANVKITPEGTVKVLDFGLAKVLAGQDSSAERVLENSPTLSMMATQEGIILGTAAYMAPEQAKGKQVDRRADIWAFGCVLYEMLAGRKPFEGETISDVLAAVIMQEPDWEALPEATPSSMRRLIRRCLQKDPKQRLRDIGEARIAIEEMLSGEGSEAEAGIYVGQVPGIGRRSPLRRVAPWALAGCFAAALAAALVFWKLGAPLPEVSPVFASIPPPPQTTFSLRVFNKSPVVVSPNGKELAFSATDQQGVTMLWVRPLASNDARAVAGTEGAGSPFWSADSDSLGFYANGKLKTVSLDNGTVQVLAAATLTWCPAGGAWNSGGTILFKPKACSGQLEEISASGGKPTPVTKGTSRSFSRYSMPAFLPDGRHFLYQSGGVYNSPIIWMGTLGSDQRELVLKDASYPQFASGHLLFERGHHVFAQPFDAATGKLRGQAVPLADGLFFSVAQGVLATQGTRAKSQMEWVDRKGKLLGSVGPVAEYGSVKISPHGKRLLADVTDPQSGSDNFWAYPAEGGPGTRLTFLPGLRAFSVWSPDGKYIAYVCNLKGKHGVCRKPSDGSGAAEQIYTYAKGDPSGASGLGVLLDWSPDGRYIISNTSTLKAAETGNYYNQVWILTLPGNRKPFRAVPDEANEFNGSFSPDGHWLSYSSLASGQPQVYVVSFPGLGAKYQISQNGALGSFWDDKGNFYFVSLGSRVMEADLETHGTSLQVKAIHPLFQLPAGGAFGGSHDGQRFLVVKSTDPIALRPIGLVLHWESLLKK